MQRTLATEIRAEGVGLHSGASATVVLSPAGPDHGIRFVRLDHAGASDVPARLERVASSRLATTLGEGVEAVATVEHLLAALVAEGVDNVRIGVSGPEVPILDGSAGPWLEHIRQAGTRAQDRPARRVRVLRAVEVRSGERRMRLSPADTLQIEATIDFDHPRIGVQSMTIDLRDFDEVAWARTFGFLDEVEELRARGFARGGDLDNAVVFTPDGETLNPLRVENEPVRHKLLDIVGDLALLGARLEGRVEALRPGHGMTLALLRALMADPEAFETIQ